MADRFDNTDLLQNHNLPDGHKSGFVTVVGKPNVGKSTLMNMLLQEKLAIISPRPQTTRDNQLGILTQAEYQIVFVDTPGIHGAHNKLGEYMVQVAKGAIPDADVVLFIVDVAELPYQSDKLIAEQVAEVDAPVLLILNKIDLVDELTVERHQAAYQELVPDAIPVRISALEGTHRNELLQQVLNHLPEGPRYFPPDQLTDSWLRDNVAEIIREKVLLLFDHEIPHSIAVQVEEFKQRSSDLTYIRAVIFVERDSQKAIVIGKGGIMLKRLGKMSRTELQDLLGTKIYLDLWVKVLKNWRKDEQSLRRLGYHHKK